MLPRRALVAAALLAASTAHAGPRLAPIQLVYARGPGAESCPDADELRRAVIKEMGYDPFADDPPPHEPPQIRVTIARRAGRLEVEMEMRDGEGRALWSVDHLRSAGDCRTLVEAVGLSIAVRIDPGPSPAPACPAPPPPPAAPARPAAPAPAPAEGVKAASAAAPPMVRLGAGAFAAVASPPAVAPGIALVADVRGSLGSIAFEARAVLPGAGGRQGQRVEATQVEGVVAPCALFGPIVGCALAEGGAVVLTGEAVPAPVRAMALFGAGFRAGFERAVSRRVVLRAHVDLLGTLTHEQALLRSAFIWSGPDAVGAIGIEVLTIASRGSLSAGRGVTSTKSSTSYEAP